jgi:hypothetical protein
MNTIDLMKQSMGLLRYARSVASFERNDEMDACIADLEQAIKQEALNLKAENAREIGLDYEPVPVKTYSGGKAWPVQTEWVGLTDHEAQWIYDNSRTPSNMMEMVEAKLKEKNSKV